MAHHTSSYVKRTKPSIAHNKPETAQNHSSMKSWPEIKNNIKTARSLFRKIAKTTDENAQRQTLTDFVNSIITQESGAIPGQIIYPRNMLLTFAEGNGKHFALIQNLFPPSPVSSSNPMGPPPPERLG